MKTFHLLYGKIFENKGHHFLEEWGSNPIQISSTGAAMPMGYVLHSLLWGIVTEAGGISWVLHVEARARVLFASWSPHHCAQEVMHSCGPCFQIPLKWTNSGSRGKAMPQARLDLTEPARYAASLGRHKIARAMVKRSLTLQCLDIVMSWHCVLLVRFHPGTSLTEASST